MTWLLLEINDQICTRYFREERRRGRIFLHRLKSDATSAIAYSTCQPLSTYAVGVIFVGADDSLPENILCKVLKPSLQAA